MDTHQRPTKHLPRSRIKQPCFTRAPRPKERGTKACEAGRSPPILKTYFSGTRRGATPPTEPRGVGGADERRKQWRPFSLLRLFQPLLYFFLRRHVAEVEFTLLDYSVNQYRVSGCGASHLLTGLLQVFVEGLHLLL